MVSGYLRSPTPAIWLLKKSGRIGDANEDETAYGPVLADSVRPVVEAGVVDLVGETHQVCDEICLEPTPGHTPGHVSVHITSQGEEALITGDCIHHPVQMTRTELVQFRGLRSACGTDHA